MKKSTSNSKTSEKFRAYLDTLTIREHADFINEVSSRCIVTRLTVYNWKSGRSGIKKIYQNIITGIIGRNIFI